MIQTHQLLDNLRRDFDEIWETRNKVLKEIPDFDYILIYQSSGFMIGSIQAQLEERLAACAEACNESLLNAELQAQGALVNALTGSYINLLGLTDRKQIIAGDMIHNKLYWRVTPEEDVSDIEQPLGVPDNLEYIRAAGNQILAAQTEYVDRWKMYNELFGSKEKDSQE